jgi:predicted ATPase
MKPKLELLALAQQVQDAAMLLAAHLPLGNTLFHLGAPAAAHTHFVQGIALYDSQQHRASAFLYGEDLGVYCRSLSALTLWCLGYPAQALARSQEALTLAQQVAPPFCLSVALGVAAEFHQFRREEDAAQACAEACIRLATEQGFTQSMVMSSILRGWALARQGQGEEGIAHMRQGLAAYQAMGVKRGLPSFLALLAEAYGNVGRAEAGLRVLTEALALVDSTGERWYESELYRLKGELLLQQSSDNSTEAETCFQQAISIARAQQAKSLELRAATSLARLWQQQGKGQEAHDLLAPIYGWFTEGFDTADLQEAKALLDALA